jgi:3-oxoadipate enol-lactonase
MPRISTNGIEIYYELHGPQDEKSPVLVLSNGILMSTASWGLNLPGLAKHLRVLLYDCRGMWRSEHPIGPYTMNLHALDLATLLDALKIPQAIIGGISYGAEVSLAFALQFPERTRALLLSSCVSQVDPVLEAAARTWAEAAKAHDAQRLFEVTAPWNFSDGWIAANHAAMAAAASRYSDLDFDAVQELLACFLRLNLTANLPRITAPTLVMVGEQDILKPRHYAEIIVNAIPKAQLVVVPGAGHALCMEKPAVFNALTIGFAMQNWGQA